MTTTHKLLTRGRAVMTILLAAGTCFADPPAQETTLPAVRVTAKADPCKKKKEEPTESTGDYTVKTSASASGLDLPILETPQSITVVTRAQMEDFQLSSANALLDTVTGFQVERVETDRTYFTARGFDVTNFQMDGTGTPFSTGNQLGDIDMALFDRVEVVRGANGLISATGYPSATVNFIRKRPTADFQASGSLTGGSWDNRRLDVDLSGSLTPGGGVRGRFVGATEAGDSYLDRLSSDKQALYGVLEADLGPRTLLTTGVTYQQKRTDGGLWGALPLTYTDGTPTQYASSTSTAANWTRWDNTDTQSFLELTHSFSESWSFKGTYTHRDQESRDKLFYVYGTPDHATGLGLYAYPSLYDGTVTQDLLDASIKGRFSLGGRTHQVMFGTQFSWATTDEVSHYGRGIGTALPDLATWDGNYPEPMFDASVDGGKYRDARSSVYAATRWSLTDRAGLLLGASFTAQRTTGEDYGVDRYRSDHAITPYAGLTYDLTPATTAYASYTEIFNPQSEVDNTLHRLDPVSGRSYEIGLKQSWLDKRLSSSLAIFRTTQDHLAQSDGYVGTIAVYRGVDATSKGVELDIAGDVTKDLQLHAGATLLSLKDPEGNDARTYVPRRLVQAGATVRIPGFTKAKVGADVVWKSEESTDVGGGVIFRQKGYALVGLMAGYEFTPRFSATVNVDNVTNEKYITSLYWTQGFYGAPTNFRASLVWRY